jgi:hypothetical protein
MLLLPGGQAGVDWVKNNQRCFKTPVSAASLVV